MRRSDKKIAALKGIKYTEKATRPKMLNELAIMRECSNRSPTMLQVIDAYEFDNNLFIF